MQVVIQIVYNFRDHHLSDILIYQEKNNENQFILFEKNICVFFLKVINKNFIQKYLFVHFVAYNVMIVRLTEVKLKIKKKKLI